MNDPLSRKPHGLAQLVEIVTTIGRGEPSATSLLIRLNEGTYRATFMSCRAIFMSEYVVAL